ncbi:MAG: imidazole glycerol phosphate synthase cyclase subunit [Oligoflexia bacterium]|nr:imidazole glycerol phosphate synthase cyclase subunit [Oligoflexia bacterium]
MLKHRMIPCLFLRNGVLVQSRSFKRYQLLGNPIVAVDRYNQWGVDELVYIDMTPGAYAGIGRDDVALHGRTNILDIIKDVSKKCFMPLTFGGGIRTLEDIGQRLSVGADKITVNTIAVDRPEFISESAKEFGSQCIILSIDAKLNEQGKHIVMRGGKTATELDVVEWAKKGEELGSGEIFLNSVDRDGTAQGYDIELIKKVSDAVNIPVIACGGVGNWGHLAEGITNGGASAVAAANIFSYKEQSILEAKKFLVDAGLNFRSEGLS